MADQPFDDPGSQQIIAVEDQTAGNRYAATVDGSIVVGDVLVILPEGIANGTDGGNAKGRQIAIAMGSIALEIALQAPFPLGAPGLAK